MAPCKPSSCQFYAKKSKPSLYIYIQLRASWCSFSVYVCFLNCLFLFFFFFYLSLLAVFDRINSSFFFFVQCKSATGHSKFSTHPTVRHDVPSLRQRNGERASTTAASQFASLRRRRGSINSDLSQHPSCHDNGHRYLSTVSTIAVAHHCTDIFCSSYRLPRGCQSA